MKKFLFTLAIVLAFGSTAFAKNVVLTMPEEIQMGVSTDNRIDVQIMLTELDFAVAGVQMEFIMEDPQGNRIPASGDGSTVYLNGAQWATGLAATFPGATYAGSKPSAGVYRLLASNTGYNLLWSTEPYVYQDPEDPDADPEEIWEGMTLPQPAIGFTVRTRAAWADMEYAILRLDVAASPISWADNTKTYTLPEMSMKIVNKDYVAETKTIDGTVTLGDLNEGFDVPVNIAMVDPTEGYVVAVTVNGAEAAIEDGVIVLPNEAGEYTVAVVITADDYEGTVEASRTYIIEQAAEPQITIEETSEYMTITAKPATSLVVAGYETFTDEDGSLYVVVPRPEAETGTTVTYTATNTEEGKLPNTVSAEATATPKAKTASSAPEFSMDMDDDFVYITATGTGTVTMLDGHEGNAIDNPVKVARPAYGEENGSYTAYATNLDEGWYVPTEGNRTFEIPAKAAKNYEIAVPTVTVTPGDDAYTISAAVEGEGNVTLWVTTYDAETGAATKTAYTNPAEVVIPRTDADQQISYYATAELTEAPEGYDTWTNNASEAVQTVIPAKPVVEPETLEGEIEFGPVNQENGQFTVTYTGSEEDVTITLDDETILPVRATANTFKLPAYGTYPVTATASKAGYKDVTGEATLVWNAPVQPKQFEGTVNVTVAEDGTVIAQYVAGANEEVPADINITVDPAKLDAYGKDIPVTVTVTAEGYTNLVVNTTVDYEAPQQHEVTAAPSTDKKNKVVKEEGVYYNAYVVTLTPAETEPNCDIYYRLGVWNAETETYDYPEDYTLYTGPFMVDDPGKYMVEAYAIAPNKDASSFTYDGFDVTVISDITALNELLGDKEVASVRYFNMAGQEMQEANGMTIVVTTYTDGTTNAVKVMK